MIVLDTSVVSELMRLQPDPAIVTWLDEQSDPLVTAPVVGELLNGLLRLPLGARRTQRLTQLDRILTEVFHGRILPFDEGAALASAAITSHRIARGRPLSPIDGQIAGICASAELPLATRNVKDFVLTGIDVFDPWNPHLPPTAGYDPPEADAPAPDAGPPTDD